MGMTRINFNIGSSGWNELTIDMNTLQLNVWQHIAATYDGSNMTIYKDGIAVISSNFSGAIGNSVNNLIIGDWATQTWGTRNFPGKIDDIGIWNRALTEQEIQNLYTSSSGDIILKISDLKQLSQLLGKPKTVSYFY